MNYIITEEELTSLEKTGNPSYRKSVEYVIGRIRSRPVMPDELLTELANELSTCEDGVQYCDICDYCINPDKFDLRDHTEDCLLRRISNRLTAPTEGGEPKIGDHVRATMDHQTWFYGTYVKESDVFAQYGVKIDGTTDVKYFIHAEKN